MQRVCGQVSPVGCVVRPILSSPSPRKLVMGNWSLSCQNEGEVAIRNSDGTRVSGKGSSSLKLVIFLSGKGSSDLNVVICAVDGLVKSHHL